MTTETKTPETLEPNGGNFYLPHPLQIDSGTFWRCKHGNTGMKSMFEEVGCHECARELQRSLELRLAEQAKRIAELEGWQTEIRGAINRSGMGIMRTSQGPIGTMIGYRPEVEEEHDRKTLEVIHENVDLTVQVKDLRRQLAEATAWRPIETAPKDGTAILVLDRDVIFQAQWGGEFHPTWIASTGIGFYDRATHWLPLPQPAMTETEEAR